MLELQPHLLKIGQRIIFNYPTRGVSTIFDGWSGNCATITNVYAIRGNIHFDIIWDEPDHNRDFPHLNWSTNYWLLAP